MAYGEGGYGRGGYGGGRGGGSYGGGRGGYGAERELPKPIKSGDELDVEIEEVGTRGDGITRVKNFVIFVAGTKKGDKVRIRIKDVMSRFATAELVGGSAAAPANAAAAAVAEAEGEAPAAEEEVEEVKVQAEAEEAKLEVDEAEDEETVSEDADNA